MVDIEKTAKKSEQIEKTKTIEKTNLYSEEYSKKNIWLRYKQINVVFWKTNCLKITLFFLLSVDLSIIENYFYFHKQQQ